MMLFKSKKALVHSPDVDIDFFDTGVLQADKLAPLQFIIYLDYVQWTSIDLMKKKIV